MKPPKTPGRKTSKGNAATALELRVSQLESDVFEMRAKMTALGEDLSALRITVRQVDERTVRGERIMMLMQGEQLKMSRTLDAIADKLQVEQKTSGPKEEDLPAESEIEEFNDP